MSDRINDNTGASSLSKAMVSNESPKKRKTWSKFGGLAEDEVMKKTLPDHLANGLDIVIIGINPGLTAAFKGHHYAGVGNHFWKCLYESQLISERMTALDDYKLIDSGIGFTNIVSRTTRSSNDLRRDEIRAGAETLKRKLQIYKPKIAVFNGKGIYEIFAGTTNFSLGLQPDTVEGTQTRIFVMPSSSARCSHLPRAADKLPYYIGLKKLRDHLRVGTWETLRMDQFVFPHLKSPTKARSSDCLPKDGGAELNQLNVEGEKREKTKQNKDKPASHKASASGIRKRRCEIPINKNKITSPYFN